MRSDDGDVYCFGEKQNEVSHEKARKVKFFNVCKN